MHEVGNTSSFPLGMCRTSGMDVSMVKQERYILSGYMMVIYISSISHIQPIYRASHTQHLIHRMLLADKIKGVCDKLRALVFVKIQIR